MTLDLILEKAWTFANSGLGLSLIASAVLYWLNRLYAAKPLWKKYEGAVISAVRQAEKVIPDGSPSAGLARLDLALKLVLATFEAVNKRRATDVETAALKDGISVAHSTLEAQGALDGPELDHA
jgi:hypothetical protein